MKEDMNMKRTTNKMRMKSKMKLLDAAEEDLIVQVFDLKGSQITMKKKKIHLKTFLEEEGAARKSDLNSPGPERMAPQRV